MRWMLYERCDGGVVGQKGARGLKAPGLSKGCPGEGGRGNPVAFSGYSMCAEDERYI